MSQELKTFTIELKSLDQEIGSPVIAGAGDVNGCTLRVVFTQKAGCQLCPNSKVYLNWIHQDKKVKGYTLYKTNLPDILSRLLPDKNVLKVSFYSPTPEGYLYLGRNHEFVEQLCQMLLSHSLEREKRFGPARASVVKTTSVSKRTVLLLFRGRNVIQEKVTLKQLVTEEMIVWGYEGSPKEASYLDYKRAKELMETSETAENISPERQREDLQEELKELTVLKNEFNKIAIARSDKLIEAHERFRKVLGGKQYKTVEPILPMDLMGMYILIPANLKEKG